MSTKETSLSLDFSQIYGHDQKKIADIIITQDVSFVNMTKNPKFQTLEKFYPGAWHNF